MWKDWHHTGATGVQSTGNYTKAEPLTAKKSVGTHTGALGPAFLVDANYLLRPDRSVGCGDDITTCFFQVGTELWRLEHVCVCVCLFTYIVSLQMYVPITCFHTHIHQGEKYLLELLILEILLGWQAVLLTKITAHLERPGGQSGSRTCKNKLPNRSFTIVCIAWRKFSLTLWTSSEVVSTQWCLEWVTFFGGGALVKIKEGRFNSAFELGCKEHCVSEKVNPGEEGQKWTKIVSLGDLSESCIGSWTSHRI